MRAALTLALAAIAMSTLTARQAFKSGVDLVRVDALVLNKGLTVPGLTAADFELRDNGVVQLIHSVALESLPLALTFVLDTSGSVAGPKMRHLASAVELMLKGLRERDRAGLVTFSHRVWQRMPLGSSFDGMKAVLTETTAVGGTALHDAAYAGLAVSNAQDARPLVVIFSDGIDNASWLGQDVVERAAQRSDAVVYGVAVAASMRPGFALTAGHEGDTGIRGTLVPTYLRRQTVFLDAVANATGGRVIRADTTENLSAAFDGILREFRTRYVIAYSPRGVDTPGWHRIELKVKGRRAEVKARRGYQR